MAKVIDLGLQFEGMSANVKSRGTTHHYGGPPVWPGANISSPEAFEKSTDHARCATKVRGWHAYHLSKGWSGLAYNLVVCPHGVIYAGRGRGIRSAANGTNEGNYGSYAICGLWGGDEPITMPAKLAILDGANRILGSPMRFVHSDWKATQCSGATGRAWKAAGFVAANLPARPKPKEVDMRLLHPHDTPGDSGGIWLQLGDNVGVLANSAEMNALLKLEGVSSERIDAAGWQAIRRIAVADTSSVSNVDASAVVDEFNRRLGK